MSSNNSPLFRLEGRRALVTGASSGLGRHFALTLAKAGAELVVAARRAEKLAELVEEIQQTGATTQAISLDVTDSASVAAAFDAIAAGGKAVDIIVNNAGVTVSKPLLEQSEADWDHVVGTNLRGSWLVSQEGARRMIAAKSGGSIVNIASILGERVANHVGPYCVSKAGLIQATKSAALELARYGIRVNAILPGYIVTDLNRDFLAGEAGERLRMRVPTRRFGHPEHLDGPLLLLASEAGIHITGAALAVDGGHLISSL
ncbi:SDR family NAD(P)-dependent oxidoreductase [Noviherbaspirillum sedimenti]|uniref:SDR family oxidoreductase n=1 Tax=Noviherbaspirillum sedimenti TaxID=2320865 RepID=A0A3A3GIS9_9BURK|nr:SDR family oxidoreductase [Noviherbaspirillum sedimenti]RJG00830.1 SDR family oxidoreductase [Noviherbaspirillum sedimenti]